MKPTFTVYVVEVPTASDLYENRLESAVLGQMLKLVGLSVRTRVATNEEMFHQALTQGIYEEVVANHSLGISLLPAVHITGHGLPGGIGMTEGSILDWEKIAWLFSDLNVALRKKLLVTLSCCYGASLFDLAFNERPVPFFAAIGNTGEPTYGETAVGIATFYHLLANGAYIDVAVEAMKAASGNNSWAWLPGEMARQSFLESLKSGENDLLANFDLGNY